MKIAVLIIVAALMTNCMGANLITNGDFSSNITGWTAVGTTIRSDNPTSGGPYVFTVSAGAAAGSLCIQGANLAAGNGVQQVISIGSSDLYVFNFKYGYTNIGSVSGFEIDWLDSGAALIGGCRFAWSFDWTTEPDPSTSDGVWSNSSSFNNRQMIEKTFTFKRIAGNPAGLTQLIPEGAAYARIKLLQYYSGYRTYFDDVRFEAVTTTRQVNFANSKILLPGLRGQNVKTFGSADIENLYAKEIIAFTKGASLRGVAGGLEADTYNWKTRTGRDVGNGQYGFKGRPTLEFLREARDSKAELFITANVRGIGTGLGDNFTYTDKSTATLAQLAADWVRYTNHIVQTYRKGQVIPAGRDLDIMNSLQWRPTTSDPYDPNYDKLLNIGEASVPKVKYWEIGNEPKVTFSMITGISVSTFVNNYKTITQAMLAEDPTIKVGPCITFADYESEYISALLADPTIRVDFISYHPYNLIFENYPNTASIETALANIKSSQIAYRDGIRTVMANYAKPFSTPLVASEFNPGSSAVIGQIQSATMAHALGTAETIFTLGELDLYAAQYWICPRYLSGENTYVDMPIKKMYQNMMDNLGRYLCDSYSDTNKFRLYSTKNGPKGQVAIYGLNMSETQDRVLNINLQNLGFSIKKVSINKLCAVTSDSSLITYPTASLDNVTWSIQDITPVSPELLSDVSVVFDDAAITVITIEPVEKICSESLVQDFNGDCVVDYYDLTVIVGNWLDCTDPKKTGCN